MLGIKAKRARDWLLPAFFAAILLAAIWLINPVLGYRLQIVSSGKLIYDVPVRDKTLEVDFRHSVNKGLIREVYQLDPANGQLGLKTGYFENYGAGMLDTVPKEVGFRREENFLVLDFPVVYQDSFTYRAGPEARHRVHYGQDILPLYAQIPMKSFEIRVRVQHLH